MDRVVFVKDIVGGSEICTWLFYGHGKRQAEITCNAIFYATDNKHIKIDFPEAKIYEECLNIMLFEERFQDAEKAAAAQNRAAILSRRKLVGNVVMSDDDNWAASRHSSVCTGDCSVHWSEDQLVKHHIMVLLWWCTLKVLVRGGVSLSPHAQQVCATS